MKQLAKVVSVTDPDNKGRIQAQLIGYDPAFATTPWVWPCSPFAGNGFGFYFLPEIGDEVWIEKTGNGEWVFSGFVWSERKPVPTDGSAKKRVLVTPAGHKLIFDDEGDITITARDNNAEIIVKADGTITLNGTDGNVVNTKCICAYTGYDHPEGTDKVKAGGPSGI
jgi:uncharacterized protein involved in type VI secretion and phage assembly